MMNRHFTIVQWKEMDRWIPPSRLTNRPHLPPGWSQVRLDDLSLLRQVKERVKVTPDQEYKMVGVRWYGEGTFHRETVLGKNLSATYVTPVIPGTFMYNRLFAWKASFAVVPPKHEDCFVSSEFPQFAVDETRLSAKYLYLFFMCAPITEAVSAASVGSSAVSRNRFKKEEFFSFRMPLPPLPVQQAIVAQWKTVQAEVGALHDLFFTKEVLISRLVLDSLGIPAQEFKALPKAFALPWQDVERWSVGYIRRDLQGASGFTNAKYPVVPLSTCLIGTGNGYSIKPVAGITPYKMLKLNALTAAGLDPTLCKYVDVPEEIANRFSLRKGDLLLCRSVGSFGHIAKCALVEEDRPDILYPDIIIRVRFDKTVLPEYVREVIQTKPGRAYFQSNARTSVGMRKIGAEDIRNFPLPLPPLDVQREIVEKVQAQRREMTRLRELAERKTREIKADVEAMILGTQPVEMPPRPQ